MIDDMDKAAKQATVRVTRTDYETIKADADREGISQAEAVARIVADYERRRRNAFARAVLNPRVLADVDGSDQ